MDIKKCTLFADVAETENFTKSGERLGYTQSGVSHILKSLEEEVGFPLFIRNKQGVKLTSNAQLILPAVRAMLSDHENLEQIISYPLDPYYYRTLGVAVKSKDNMSPAAVKFLNLTKEMIPELM